MAVLIQDYVVTGYRSLEKQFHTAGSLTYCFTKSEQPTIQNIAPNNKIDIFQYNTDDTTWKEITGDIKSISDYDIECIYPYAFTFVLNLSSDMDFNTAEYFLLLYNYAGSIIDNIELIILC